MIVNNDGAVRKKILVQTLFLIILVTASSIRKINASSDSTGSDMFDQFLPQQQPGPEKEIAGSSPIDKDAIDRAIPEAIVETVSRGESVVSEASAMQEMHIGDRQVDHVGYDNERKARYAHTKPMGSEKRGRRYWLFDDGRYKISSDLRHGNRYRLRNVPEQEFPAVFEFFNGWDEHMPAKPFYGGYVALKPARRQLSDTRTQRGDVLRVFSDTEIVRPSMARPSSPRRPSRVFSAGEETRKSPRRGFLPEINSSRFHR